MIANDSSGPELQRMRTLPDFKKPPINEAVLSIQFAPLVGLKSAYIGLFWERIRKEFPNVSEQGAIPPVFETFGGIKAAEPPFRFETFMSPPLPRYWFENPANGDLLQVQQDRIVRNWRQGSDNGRAYPRYETIRHAFENNVGQFGTWLSEWDLGSLVVNQCEVTYINLIRLPDSSNPHQQLERISSLWTGRFEDGVKRTIENTNVQLTCVFHHDGKPAGRIYASFQSVFMQATLDPVVKLEITARGKPSSSDVKDAFTYLDIIRQQVVETFAAVTTAEMHEFWERTS